MDKKQMEGDKMGAVATKTSNVYEIRVKKGRMEEALERFKKPGITKEYLETCKKTSKMYRR